MKDQNRFKSNDDDYIDSHVMTDHTEATSRFAQAIFTLQNPLFIPALAGSIGVFIVFVVLCRSYLYRKFISIVFGNRFFDQKSPNSRLRSASKQRQYHFMSSLSKP